MNKDGSGVTQLTSSQDGYEYGYPSWSPDGTKIAFATGGANFQIAVVATDGSGVTQLTHDVGLWNSWPDWSPDGSRIAFYRQTQYQSLESDDRIFVMNADGTGAEALTRAAPLCDQPWGFGWPRWHDFHPQWSPDGTRILFVRLFECDDDPTNDYEAIFTMNADGTDPVEFLRNAHGAAWSPDGRQIAYIQEHIYVTTATGTVMVRESHGWEQGEEYSHLAWTG
jgi:TolB protein